MTQPNNLLPSDLTWPASGDVEQNKAMQTLWEAEIAWNQFVGIVPATLPSPAHARESDEEAA
jgi:hypothetical protein